jgi:hypothetical protein
VFKLKKTCWLVLLGLVWTACSPMTASGITPVKPGVTLENPPSATPTQPAEPTAPLPDAVTQARTALAKELGIAQNVIKVISFERIDWPDTCLGAPKPNEDCAATLTAGYLIRLEGAGKSVEMHSNLSGSDLRTAQPDVSGTDSSVKAIALLAKLAGLKVEETRVSRIEQHDWPDACLGVANVGEVCSAVITPGYYFELTNGAQVYWLRTDQEISEGRIAGPQDTLIGTRVRLKAAKIAGLPVEDLKVSSLESVEWPNSCLGNTSPGVMCLDVITPGYKVVLTNKGSQLVFHTNRDASSVVLEKK